MSRSPEESGEAPPDGRGVVEQRRQTDRHVLDREEVEQHHSEAARARRSNTGAPQREGGASGRSIRMKRRNATSAGELGGRQLGGERHHWLIAAA